MESEPKNTHEEVMTLLFEIRRMLAEQADRASRRWNIVVGVAVACVIFYAPANLSYILGLANLFDKLF